MNTRKQSQTLKPLPREIRSIVRSGITINTVAQCVEELAYNSVDVGAKVISIGVNLDQFNVRVEDDGDGLTEVDLEAVGVRYNTSKCTSLVDLNNLKYYGFRGEALASIVEVSSTVQITTRPKATAGIELKKRFESGVVKGFIEKYNTSVKKSGTTVLVEKLLSKLPVRQQRIDKSLQIEEVKNSLETIAIINPHLNIELRNEKNGTQLFSFLSSSCYSDAINQIYKSRIGFEVKFVQEHFLHKKLFFSLSVSNDFVKKKNYQFVFLNNRFIRRSRIHKWLGNLILDKPKDSRSPKSDKYPIFILNITCPLGEYDITLEPKKQVVEFKDWDAVGNGIDGLVLKLKHKNSLSHLANSAEPTEKNASRISSYDVKGALHSRFVARESKASEEQSSKSSCADSDQESLGITFVPKPERKSREWNLSRSGHSTHVVNVREIRKKRKLENIIAKPVPKLLTSKPRPSANKPNLTLSTFKKFPAWDGEFETTHPPKKSKNAHNQENYKYYVPDIQSSEKGKTTEEKKDSPNYRWKINKFLQDVQSGADTTATSDDVPVGVVDETMQSRDSVPQSDHPDPMDSSNDIAPFGSKSQQGSTNVENDIFETTERIVGKHLEGKFTLKDVKGGIISRLFKYYKATKRARKDTIKCTTATTTNPGGQQLKAVSTTVANSSTNNLERTEQGANLSEGFTTPINVPTDGHQFKLPGKQNCSFLKTSASEFSKMDIFHTNRVSATAISNDSNLIQTSNTAVGRTDAGCKTDYGPPPIFQMHKHLNLVSVNSSVCDNQHDLARASSHVPRIPTTGNEARDCKVDDGKQFPQFPLSKPSNLETIPLNQGASPEKNSAAAPPLLNLFPIQKSFSSDWNDKMISNDYTEADKNLFPSDWAAEIVLDRQGQEWLHTLDNIGGNIYINLSSGESSSTIDHLQGSVRKITAGEMKKHNPIRYNWLRKHFPRSFKQFWNGDSREIVKDGDLTKLNNTALGGSLLKCINQQKSNDQLSKWTDTELQNVSKYFSGSKDSNIKTINNVTATGIQCWKNLGGATSSFRFSREDFELIRVIGQYDRKFILAGIRKSYTESETLVVFDQHAVHERIRLEGLIGDSFTNSKAAVKYLRGSEVMPPYQLCLSETEVRVMQSYVDVFRQAALNFETVNSTVVKIKSVPKCFMEKCTNEPVASRNDAFRNLVHSFIQELIHTIMETKVASLTGLPKTVHSVLCSQACHGAIKFGDVLSLDDCKDLIVRLRSCKNLFQCAHGRPSVVPLIKGQDMLKVSAAGYSSFKDRLPSGTVAKVCRPCHEECSNYFCDPVMEKTSGYFSFLGASTASNNDTSKGDKITFFMTAPDEKKLSESTTSDFFSFTSGVKRAQTDDADEESPYFFGLP